MTAVCVLTSTIDPDAIDAHCRARMAAFKRPKRIDIVTELPKTATGKIQKYVLRGGKAAISTQ